MACTIVYEKRLPEETVISLSAVYETEKVQTDEQRRREVGGILQNPCARWITAVPKAIPGHVHPRVAGGERRMEVARNQIHKCHFCRSTEASFYKPEFLTSMVRRTEGIKGSKCVSL